MFFKVGQNLKESQFQSDLFYLFIKSIIKSQFYHLLLLLCLYSYTCFAFQSIYEPPHGETIKMAGAPSENSDQTGHPLIWVFAVRSMGS